VVPFLEYGSLLSVLKENARLHPEFLDLQQELLFALDIASGMEFLARHKVIHRDLAARNVLVSNTWTGVVADFGLAREASGYTTARSQRTGYYRKVGDVVAAVRWMPPEVRRAREPPSTASKCP
jgi:serine/threonine protein kinase